MSISFLSESTTWEEVASSMPSNSTDTERLMAAICYRFEHEQADSTDVAVIANDYFRRARWPRPTNLAATANHCAGKGWLSEAGRAEGRKLWRITRKGYDATKVSVLQS
jgi:hypothetical protein